MHAWHKFYSCRDEERLTHTDPDEAIESYLDDCFEPDGTLNGFPETVTLRAYDPFKLDPEVIAGEVLERTIKACDEEYGDPTGDDTPQTARMKEAALAFAKVFVEEYEVFMCLEADREEVDVESWVKQHHPEWLEDESGAKNAYYLFR
jgi:hypothetical protein